MKMILEKIKSFIFFCGRKIKYYVNWFREKTSIWSFVLTIISLILIVMFSQMFFPDVTERVYFTIFRVLSVCIIWRFAVKFTSGILMKTRFNRKWIDIPVKLEEMEMNNVPFDDRIRILEQLVIQDNARHYKNVILEVAINIGSAGILVGMWALGIL